MSNQKLELAKDIIAFASILSKFGGDNILENQTLLVEALNVAGFRTQTGKEFTKMSFRNMFERLSASDRRELMHEITQSNRSSDMVAVMFGK
ncbi:MAG: hypothetical protein ACRCWQ_14800 [Bacilli bacterium]